jgi:hypothetical protein
MAFTNGTKYISICIWIKKTRAGHWWLTPVILATPEAEIRRIVVRRQLRANSS